MIETGTVNKLRHGMFKRCTTTMNYIVVRAELQEDRTERIVIPGIEPTYLQKDIVVDILVTEMLLRVKVVALIAYVIVVYMNYYKMFSPSFLMRYLASNHCSICYKN
jgi:hypothetical protein